jgi:phage terminase large subunit
MSSRPPVIEMPVIEGLYFRLLNSPKKINVVQGGGDAGKTVTILQVIATDLINNPKLIATVTAQDGPNLKAGALRTFQRYVEPYIGPFIRQYNISEKTYYFGNGSVLEFKSFQDEQDARGAERDILFMNEANSRPYEFFWQLQRKTRQKVYLDYNPTSSFWVHNKVIPGAEELEQSFAGKVKCFLVDHRSNPYLTAEQHQEYESMSDPDLFQVYARGKVGKIKGLIYGHFKKVSGPPQSYDRIIWGIDYGYTNDPTALTKIWCWGRKRWVQELCYRPGVSAQELKNLITGNGYQAGQTIWSEHDQHMINQLRVLGLPVYPAHKGPNSIAPRIAAVRQHEVYYFDSPNLENEIKNYKFVTVRDIATGKEVMTNLPVDAYNHLCDSAGYAIYSDSLRNRQ